MNQNSSTVLVIDDDHCLAELLACFLCRADFRPVIALNGTDGVLQAQSLCPSVVLCDSCMPGVGGLEVIERLRAEPTTAHIPIILMSGHDPASFDGSGAEAFLQKPFLMSEMVAVVQTFFTPQRIVAADENAVPDLESTA